MENDFLDMSEQGSSAKIRKTVHLTQQMIDQTAALAGVFGITEGEVMRLAIIEGLAHLCEKSNKLLVNERLRKQINSSGEE